MGLSPRTRLPVTASLRGRKPSDHRISGLFFTFATWIHVPTRQGAELRGENAGFSTFFSTVVENFGGRPYGGAAGDVTLAHARSADNPLPFSWRVPDDAQGLTPPWALRYYQRFSATCSWRQGIRDHETYVPAKPSSPPSHTRLPGAHEHEERSARPEASPSQGPEAADGLVASLIESGHHAPAPAGWRQCSPSVSAETAGFAGVPSSSEPFPSELAGTAATSRSSLLRTQKVKRGSGWWRVEKSETP